MGEVIDFRAERTKRKLGVSSTFNPDEWFSDMYEQAEYHGVDIATAPNETVYYDMTDDRSFADMMLDFSAMVLDQGEALRRKAEELSKKHV